MKKIFKYQFQFGDNVKIKLPLDCEIISVQLQNGVPTLWALCYPNFPLEKRVLYCYYTGEEVGNGFKHLATLQSGGLVWHVFI